MATFCLSDAGEQEDVRPDQQTITCRFEFNSVVIRIGDMDRFELSKEEAGRFLDQISEAPCGCIVVADVKLSADEAQVLAAQIVRVLHEHETFRINWMRDGF